MMVALTPQVAFLNFQPEMVVYNAGTDILDGDPLGLLKASYTLQVYHHLSI